MMEKNLIIHEMKTIEYINDDKITKILLDKNLAEMLEILYEPKTLQDIFNHFDKKKQKKSLKTIYRYILLLKKVGLVIEAGKRVYENLNLELKNETLYTRTAKAFISNSSLNTPSVSNIIEKDLKILETILKKKYEYFCFESPGTITKYIKDIFTRKKAINEEIIELLLNDFRDLLCNRKLDSFFYIIELISWLELIHCEEKPLEELLKIVKKNRTNL